jgi:hypothetical protein
MDRQNVHSHHLVSMPLGCIGREEDQRDQGRSAAGELLSCMARSEDEPAEGSFENFPAGMLSRPRSHGLSTLAGSLPGWGSDSVR